MKKLISIFLSIALLCTMVFPAFATEVGTATVDTVTGVHGETVLLTLNISDFDEADTILVTFEVPEALELILEDSEWLLEASVLTDISDGMAVCATAAPEELSGDILTLALRLPAEGDLEPVYEIDFLVTLRKYNNIVAEVQVKGAVATSADATKVTVSQSTLTLDLNGTKQATLTAAVEPIYSTDTVSWSSSDVTVATVDENGVVTAVKKGNATITATAGQCSDSCTVNVMCSHQEVVDKAVAPDCENTGLTEGKHCSVCNEVLVAQETVDALNHSWNPADCETPKTCKVCGETEGEALGHDWVDADCETAKTCSVCGETEGEALGHDWVDADCETPKTCKVCGETEGEALGHDWVDADCETPKTCKVCGETEGEALGHDWVDADCETPKTCKVCGETEGEALGHDWVDADCETAKTCKVCGETEGEALGHTVVIDKAVAPTCTTTGLTEGKHCSVCNKVLDVQQVVPANGHKDTDKDYICDICNEDLCTDHQETVMAGKDATCTENGLTEGKKCALCGDIIKAQEVIPAKGHTEVTDKAVAATCTTTGKTEGKHCTVCGAVTKAQQTVPAKGHTEVTDKAVAATCTAAGKTEGKHCSVCGAVTKAQQTVPAKGHTEVTDKAVAATCTAAGKTEGKHCSVCGAVTKAQQTVPAKGHTEVTDKAVAATCTAAGKTEGKHCSVCGAVTKAQQTVPAKGHSWKDATCTAAKTCKTCGATSGRAKGHTYRDGLDGTCNTCGVHRETTENRTVMHMFRMYDPNSGEHFYTGSVEERENLVAVGWNYEGVGFTFSRTTGMPVYRLFDPIYGEHLYTMEKPVATGRQYISNDQHNGKDLYECEGRIWLYEGIAFNSAYDTEVPQYRLRNPNENRGAYHFTSSTVERDNLIAVGWISEGICFYSSWK